MAGKVAGSGGGKRGQLDVTAEPNVIPFIDVMLVLLIIFMIAAPIASVDVQVSLPKSQIMPSRRPPSPTWVSLQDQGSGVQTFVMNDPVPLAEIGERAYEHVNTTNPDLGGVESDIVDQRIYIRADADTPYRNVVAVMNQLQNRGFSKIALVTEDRRR